MGSVINRRYLNYFFSLSLSNELDTFKIPSVHHSYSSAFVSVVDVCFINTDATSGF